jgi:CPA2 family monovalent cation:H+ antiporter-2
MGKHGTHVTEELLLGSVTRRVLAESQADVLVVVDPLAPPPVPAS